METIVEQQVETYRGAGFCGGTTICVTDLLALSSTLGQEVPISTRRVVTESTIQISGRVAAKGADRGSAGAPFVLNGAEDAVLELCLFRSDLGRQLVIQITGDAAARKHVSEGRQGGNSHPLARFTIGILANA